MLFAFLFFVMAGVVLPHITFAQLGLPGGGALPAGGPPAPAANALPSSSEWCLSLGCVAKSVVKGIIAYFALLPILLTGTMDIIAGTLLKWVLVMTRTIRFTSLDPTVNPAVALGWPIVRNFANIIIVLGFITIAVATILRIKEYEAKQLLAKLVIVALLVNFSLVICGFVIDVSTITINFFLTGDSDWVNDFVDTEALDRTIRLALNIVSTTPIMNFLGQVSGNIFYNVISSVILSLYICLFLFRIIALWILVILSPLAFVCYVFPITKSAVFDKWWSNFVQWSFVGVFGAFFLYIGRNTMNAMNRSLPPISLPENANVVIRYMTEMFQPLFTILVPGLFLVIGFIFSLQMSAMGSGAAIGAFKSSGKYIRKAGSLAWDKSGMKKYQEKAGVWATRKLEGRYGFKAGTANQMEQAQNEARMKPYSDLAAAERDSDVLAKRAMTSKNEEERAAIAKELHKRKKLGKIKVTEDEITKRNAAEHAADPSVAIMTAPEIKAASIKETDEKRQQIVDDAKSHGIDTSEFAESAHGYAKFDTKRVEERMDSSPATDPATAVEIADYQAANPATDPAMAAQITAYQAANPGTSTADAHKAIAHRKVSENAVEKEQLEQNLPTMNNKQLKDMHHENAGNTDLTPDIVAQMTARQIRAFRGDAIKIAHLKALIAVPAITPTPVPPKSLADMLAAAKAGGVATRNKMRKIGDVIDAIRNDLS